MCKVAAQDSGWAAASRGNGKKNGPCLYYISPLFFSFFKFFDNWYIFLKYWDSFKVNRELKMEYRAFLRTPPPPSLWVNSVHGLEYSLKQTCKLVTEVHNLVRSHQFLLWQSSSSTLYVDLLFPQCPSVCGHSSFSPCLTWLWNFWNKQVNYFVECPSSLVWCHVFYLLDSLWFIMIHWGESHGNGVPFSGHHSVSSYYCLFLLHLTKVVSTRILCCKISTFFFEITKCLRVDTWRLCKYLVYLSVDHGYGNSYSVLLTIFYFLYSFYIY